MKIIKSMSLVLGLFLIASLTSCQKENPTDLLRLKRRRKKTVSTLGMERRPTQLHHAL